MSSPEVVALMLADGRLPTGGHTQSAGLEPAVRAGLGADGKQPADVGAYARDRLRTVTRTEAAVAVLARHYANAQAITTEADKPSPAGTSGTEPFVMASRFVQLESAWAARTPSRALRTASRRQGRAYLRLAERVWPDVLQHLPRDSEIARPLVIGAIGAVTGLSPEQVARLVAYDDAQTVIAASLKLLPGDPAVAVTWLAALHDDIERLVNDVAPLTDIDKIPAAGAPLIDQFAEQHAIERMRLFHA
ncbi:urease accessory protein UreF [Kribbella antibiotica]|uniref:Urease accessory protein UreF n=1 Tax=Kribbella antibiotica TaxID=190195 RepID=A0A4R4Z589_9ACTN|nr:urease accessory UreF family protein [Kribbella antibiotica]TDD52640.1 urease accessory protein UreF [Kribbella antibiotica]